jgi:hypothetical protein
MAGEVTALPRKQREVNVFDVPPDIALSSGISTVGLVTLTSDDELACWTRAKNSNAKLATELAKTSLVEADGKPLSLGDGTVDSFWGGLDPKLRQLIMGAYTELHAASDEAQASFLKSRRVKVG